jgi:hypothetical protein
MFLSVQNLIYYFYIKTMHLMNAVILSTRWARWAGCRTNDNHSEHRHLSGCESTNRMARCDHVGRPPSMPNCTNWNASCPATLHRTQGFPVHQLACSWFQYRLTGVSTYLSKSKLPRVKLSPFSCPEWARALWAIIPNYSHSSLAKTINWLWSSNSTLVRTFDMACYATGVLITRI